MATDRNGNDMRCRHHVRGGDEIVLGPGEPTEGGFDTVRIESRCRHCWKRFETWDIVTERVPNLVGVQHDPYTYPVEKGVWYRGKAGITTDQARAIQRRNKVLGENHRRSPQGGRLKASIPAALYWAQRRMHGPDYWKEKKNVDRVTKDWGVGK